MTEVFNDPNAFPELGFVDQDIVDTGRLRDSQKLKYEGSTQATFTWDPVDPETKEHYASGVYYGFFAYKNPRNYVPGRQWDKKALQRFDFGAQMKKHLRG
jgi:hypothetical protein